MWNALAIIASVVSLAALASAEATDHCYDVLSDHLLHQYSSLDQHNLSQSLRNSACNEINSGNSGSSSVGLSVGLPIDGIPMDFGGSYGSQYKNYLSTKYCSDSASQLSSNDLHELEQRSADPQAYKQWGDCMRTELQIQSHGTGLQLAVTGDGDDFVLQARWETPPAGANQTTITGFYPVCGELLISPESAIRHTQAEPTGGGAAVWETASGAAQVYSWKWRWSRS